VSIDDGPVAGTKRPPRPRYARLLTALGVLIVVGVIVATVITFLIGGHSRTVAGDEQLRDGIRVHASAIHVMPEQDHLILRLGFEPIGDFTDGDRHVLTNPVRIEAVGGAEILTEDFAAGALIPPQDLTVALGNGEIAEYPFDGYDAQFQVRVTTPAGEAVPSVLMGETAVHGYRISVIDPVSEPNGGHDLTMNVTRGPATLVFGAFVALLMWALTILVLVVAAKHIRSDEPIDIRLISLLGVLLFAFPAMRNAVPNAPAVGVLDDFLSFFWCEIALGLGMVALLISLIRHKDADSTSPQGGSVT
jgi:hypothetical protein